jgi:hypothetical protein
MSIKGKDREFGLAKLSYVDFKYLEMDRVLTMLFPRLKYDGYASRREPRKTELTVAEFQHEFLEHPEWFEGFSEYPEVTRCWIETELMDLVNRGKPIQAVAAPRPLHGNTYKFRNSRHARDYGAAEHLYWMLYHARQGRGQAARDALRRFFFPGVDLLTDRHDPSSTVDVETQALLRLDEQVTADMRDSKEPERYPPLCIGQADILADDVLRLLSYEAYVPRSVLVEYLKTLFAFHLALYHLRLFKLLPALVSRRGGDPICDPQNCPVAPQSWAAHGNCPYRVYFLVDFGSATTTPMAELARQSASTHYRRIPDYIQAHYLTRKLDEFARYLSTSAGKLPTPATGYFSVGELLQLLEPPLAGEREGYFKMRLAGLLEDTVGDVKDELDPEIRRITQMNLNDLDTFIEVLMALRGPFHRRYITEFIDSLLKRGSAGMMHQSKSSPRRFAMGSLLLEVLLQIAVLDYRNASFRTKELRIDELLDFFRERYGIFVDTLPHGDGFAEPSIDDRRALRANLEEFKRRLRELGFFSDLSDAYVTQTIAPRYSIGQPVSARGRHEK